MEVINQADTLAYATEKSLKDFGDKVSQTERADIEQKANDLKSAMKDKNVERIKKGMEELTKAAHKLAEEIYKQSAQKKQGPGAGPGPDMGQGQAGPQQGPGPESQRPTQEKKKAAVIDAEFKEE